MSFDDWYDGWQGRNSGKAEIDKLYDDLEGQNHAKPARMSFDDWYDGWQGRNSGKTGESPGAGENAHEVWDTVKGHLMNMAGSTGRVLGEGIQGVAVIGNALGGTAEMTPVEQAIHDFGRRIVEGSEAAAEQSGLGDIVFDREGRAVAPPTWAQGVTGSMASMIPYMGIGMAAQGGGSLASRALRFGVGMGVPESVAEAGGAYNDVRRQGGSNVEARSSGLMTALLNLPLDVLTDAIAGPVGESGMLRRGLSEGFQEFGQAIISGAAARRNPDGSPTGLLDTFSRMPEELKKSPEILLNESLPALLSSAIFGGAESAGRRFGGSPQSTAALDDAVDAILQEAEAAAKGEGAFVVRPDEGSENGGVMNWEETPEAGREILAAGGVAPPLAPEGQPSPRVSAASVRTLDRQRELLNWGKSETDRIEAETAAFSGENETADNAMSGEELTRDQELQDARKRKDYARLEELRAAAVMSNADKNAPPAPPVAAPVQSTPVQGPQNVDITSPEKTTQPYGASSASVATETGNGKDGQVSTVSVPPVSKPVQPATGKVSKVVTNAGTEVETRFKVAEADDLLTSDREGYPADVQPRNRGRLASRQQIEGIISNLDPSRLADNRLASDGAPIVGGDNVVESGNGRVMALREAYRRGVADYYRQYLIDNAESLGLSKGAVEALKNPVLVRERVTDVDRVKFAQEANESSVSAMSESETALRDAKNMDSGILENASKNPDLMTNTAFFRDFFEQVVPANERGQFIDQNGRISQAGYRRVRNALAAKAYGDDSVISRLSESTDDNIRNVNRALVQAAPSVALVQDGIARGALREDLSLSRPIIEAANTLSFLREDGTKVSEFLDQRNLFDEDDISPEARKILQFFDRNKQKPNVMTSFLTDIAKSVENQGAANQRVLFDDGGTETLSDIIDRTAEKYAPSKARQTSLFGDEGQAVHFQEGVEGSVSSKYKTQSGKDVFAAEKSDWVVSPDGKRTLGHIDADSQNNIEDGDVYVNAGMIQHAEQEHGDQIREAGYSDALAMVTDVLSNYTEIRNGNNGVIYLVKRDNSKKDSPLVVVGVTKESDGAYHARSERIERHKSLDRKDLLSTRNPHPSTPTPASGLASLSDSSAAAGEESVLVGRQESKSSEKTIPPTSKKLNVKDDVRRQLAEAGESEERADAAGDIISSAMTTFAAREGLSPEEFYERLDLKFVRGEVDPKTGEADAHLQFAGENSNTSGTVRGKLVLAKILSKSGLSQESVFRKTGWYKGMDGQWRYEIPDNIDGIHLDNFEKKQDDNLTLQEIYDNDALYNAYPKLAFIPVILKNLSPGTGAITSINRYAKTGEIKDISIELSRRSVALNKKESLLHEIQHVIQEYEGFASGSSPEMFQDIKVDGREVTAFEQYANTAGEIEAVDTANRARRSEKERKSTLPAHDLFLVDNDTGETTHAGKPIIVYGGRIMGSVDSEHAGGTEAETAARNAEMPRTAKSATEARDVVRDAGIIGKPLANKKFDMVATVSNVSLNEMISERAVKKSVSPSIHAIAVANVDKLFESASVHTTHSDTHERGTVKQVHRLGALLKDGSDYYPVKLTVKEFHRDADGTRIYSVEAIDVEAIKKSAGQLVAADKSVGTTPIADFDNRIMRLLEDVKSLPTQKQSNARGSINLSNLVRGLRGENTITLSDTSDATTLLHEPAHLFRELMRIQAEKFTDDAQLQADWKSIQEYGDHEQFAKGFVEYVDTGQAPNSALARAFMRFKQWLAELWSTISRSGDTAALSEEMRGVFGRILAGDSTFQTDYGHDSVIGAAGGGRYEQGGAVSNWKENLANDAAAWSGTLDEVFAKDSARKDAETVDVMTTPLALNLVGADVLPLRMSVGKIRKISAEHQITPELMKQMPDALADPVMIFASSTKPNALVVMTELRDKDGATVIVPVHLARNVDSDGKTINWLASIYGQATDKGKPRDQWFISQIRQGHLKYIDTKKSSLWLSASGLQLPKGTSIKSLSQSLPTESDLVKLRGGKGGTFYQSPAQVNSRTTKSGVEVRTPVRDKSNDTGPMDLLNSPNVVAERHAKFRPFYRMAKDAYERQEKLRAVSSRYGDKIWGKPGFFGRKGGLVSEDQRETFANILIQGDFEGKVFSNDELREMGAADKTIQAYQLIRALYAKARNMINEQRRKYGKEEMNELTGYIPHFFHTFRVMDKSGQILGTFRSMREAVNAAEKMGGKDLTVAPFMDDFGGQAQLDAVTLGDMQYFKLVQNTKDVFALSAEDARGFLDDVARMGNRSRVFKNAMRRKGTTGWDTDMEYAFRHYMNYTARYIAMDDLKHKGTNLFERTFGRFGNDHKGLARYTKDYLNDCLGVPSQWAETMNNWVRDSRLGERIKDHIGDRPAEMLANNIARVTAIAKLGFLNPMSAAMNVTQLIGTAAKIGYTATARGMAEYTHPTARTKALYREAGIEENITAENPSGYSNAHNLRGLFGSLSMGMFRWADGAVRKVTFLGAYRKGRAEGMSHAEAVEYGKEINDLVNFDYSVADAPNFMRRTGPVGTVALQFKKFPVKMLEFAGGLKGMENVKFWVPMLALSGLLGVPGFELLKEFVKWLTGTDVELEMKKFVGESDLPAPVKRTLLYGGLSNVGVDVGRRAGMGDFIPSQGSDFLGPTVSTLWRVIPRIFDDGNFYDTLDAISPGLSNPIKAFRGTKDKRGREKFTPDTAGEKAARFLGARPLREAIESDAVRLANYETQKRSNEETAAIDDYLDARERYKPGDPEYKAALARINKLGINQSRILAEYKKRKGGSAFERKMKEGKNRKARERRESMSGYAEMWR